jgi:LmbE family N-acetylglucosaminyl deacetylase/protein-L-isoaspartate O-methyltransferase
VVTFDATLPGTQPGEWTAMERLRVLPPLDLAGIEQLTVVAAHPDDETLGAGGLLVECARQGIPITVVVVTDGSASHPASRTVDADQLAAIRQRELFLAVSELCPGAEVVMCGFKDGQTSAERDDIEIALARVIGPASTLVAPWRGDGHRDHRVVGELGAEIAARNGATLFEYPIWMWHWAQPDDERVPWESAQTLRLDHSARNVKRRALALHHSQVAGVGPARGDEAVLTEDFRANFERDSEVFFVSKPRVDRTKSRQYFDSLYAANGDPWRLGTRWYEERKRAITVASLPSAHYQSGLEIGCSTGELTARLAPRCDSLLAIDISAAAVSAATRRVTTLDNVRVVLADATVQFPQGDFDLIVLSEVAYYWDRPTLIRMIEKLRQHLTHDGTLVACHWRHAVEDYPLGGDEVHRILHENLALETVAVHDEVDFLLEVFAADPRSVATREGLVG